MLIRVKISNFMSIGDMQELCMISGKARGKKEHLYKSKDISLLRLSAIYGANASGKSNLISALKFAQKLIVNDFPSGYSDKYNRTKESNIDKVSHFEFHIKNKNKYYTYGFEIYLNKNSIVREWLYEVFEEKERLIFTRDLTKSIFKLGEFSEEISNRLNIYFDDTKSMDTILFLSEMNRNKSDMCKKHNETIVFNNVFKWFDENLDINYPDRMFSNYSYFMKNKKFEDICNIIRTFDTGITSFKIIDTKKEDLSKTIPSQVLKGIFEDLEGEVILAKKEENHESRGAFIRGDKEFYIFNINKDYEIEIKTIEFRHGECGRFSLGEESDGTRRILELIEILFTENDNKVYIIDEIDRSLHPLLTKQFITAYIDSLKNRNIQLIVTTHESRLLDLDILRRDEVWFMNKNSIGNSELYSLEQYNERFDRRIDKSYLDGRYGAIPNFGKE